MLCCVPNIEGSYGNIQLLFNLININKIPFKFVADFIIILTVNGKQTASSSYPSPYCRISLRELRVDHNNNELGKGDSKTSSSDGFLRVHDNCLKLITYGDLRED